MRPIRKRIKRTRTSPETATFFAVHLTCRFADPARLAGGFAFFAAAGIGLSQVVHSAPPSASTRLSVYLKSGGASARLARFFQRFGPPGWNIRRERLGREDWLTKWQDVYRISSLGKSFTVVPLWRKSQFQGRKSPVYIDPQGSFGSGTHETTRRVVELMEGIQGRFRTFLDAGTGTGILLVVAERLGAERALGIDIDPQAVRVARQNLKHNRAGRGVTAKTADILRPAGLGRYDLIAANLLSRTLVDSASILVRRLRPGGHLIVSGIERGNWRWFLRHFKPAGLVRERVSTGRRWNAALYRLKK